MAKELKNIKGVEIFSVGQWNGDVYTAEDLDEMVRAFNEMRDTLKPALKLGHTDKQKLIQQDGMPAAGWIGGLYRLGQKLVADFVDIPEKIFELIENKAYRKVSSEIYWNIDINGKQYRRMLSAVALLGADMPAVTNLRDILALYGLTGDAAEIKSYATDPDGLIIKQYTTDSGEQTEVHHMAKTEAEIKLELELKAAQDKAAALEVEKKNFAKEADDAKALAASKDAELKKHQVEAAARTAEAQKQAAEAEIDKTLTELSSEKLVTPAMKPYVRALLGEEKKEYSIKVKDEEKKLSKAELLKEALKLHSAATEVNFEESSEEGDEQANKGDGALNEKIEKYMADNKCSYGIAYRAVHKASTK